MDMRYIRYNIAVGDAIAQRLGLKSYPLSLFDNVVLRCYKLGYSVDTCANKSMP